MQVVKAKDTSTELIIPFTEPTGSPKLERSQSAYPKDKGKGKRSLLSRLIKSHSQASSSKVESPKEESPSSPKTASGQSTPPNQGTPPANNRRRRSSIILTHLKMPSFFKSEKVATNETNTSAPSIAPLFCVMSPDGPEVAPARPKSILKRQSSHAKTNSGSGSNPSTPPRMSMTRRTSISPNDPNLLSPGVFANVRRHSLSVGVPSADIDESPPSDDSFGSSSFCSTIPSKTNSINPINDSRRNTHIQFAEEVVDIEKQLAQREVKIVSRLKEFVL